jgi:WD40 repeat protein
VATGKELRRINGKDLTRDGKTLIHLAPEEKKTTFRFSEAATGKLLREITVPHGLQWMHVVVSPDHKTIAGEVEETVYIWDAATGKELHRLAGGENRVYWLAYSPDGKTLAACFGDKTVKLWDVASGKQLHRWDGFPGTGGNTAAFSPDGKTLAVPWKDKKDKTIRLLETESGKEVSRIQVSRFTHLGVAFAPDGKTLAWGAQSPGAEAGLVHLWDLATGKERRPLGRLSEAVKHVAFSANGKTFLTVEDAKEPLRFWETATGRELRQFKLPFHYYTAVSRSGQLLATAGEKLQLWDLAAGKEVALHGRQPKDGVKMAFSPDGRLLAVAADGKIQLWDTAKGEERRSLGNGDLAFHAIAFATDGKTLFARLRERDGSNFKAWDVTTGKLLHNTPAPSLIGTFVSPMAVSPDSRILAVVSHKWDAMGALLLDVQVLLWDLTTGKVIHELRPTPQRQAMPAFRVSMNDVTSLAFSPDGRTLACAYHGGGIIRLWEVATGQERKRFEGHRQLVRCLAFSADGSLLASGADDNTALVWDVLGRLDNGSIGQSDLSAEPLRGWWADLAAKDAAVAYRAMCRLRAGRQTVPFLNKHLKPVAALDARQREQVFRWIADLDSPQFAARQKATSELEKLGDLAEPALRAALADKPSLELRSRVKPILENLDPSRSPQRMQALRAVEVLEHIATPEAREVLRALAGGAPAHYLTREAKASLKRLSGRTVREP